jgi:hypothetical protein
MNLNCKEEAGESWLHVVAEQAKTLRFGVIQIVVHENRVVQVEKTEKVRFDQSQLKH